MRPTAARLLAKAKLSAFLVTNPVHLQYLTGSDVETGGILITKSSCELYTSLAFLNNRKAIENRGIAVFDRSALPRRMRKIRRCGIESDYVTLEMESYLKKKYPSTNFVQKNGIVADFRRQKSPEERRLMQRAWAITKKLLREAKTYLRVDMTEREVAGALYQRAMQLGASGWAFEPIVAFGPHTSFPHHRAGKSVLRSRDIVQLDIGVKVDGYCSDGSDVYFVGRPSDEQKRQYLLLKRALREVQRLVKSGVSVRRLDRLARSILREQNLEQYFTHALGHGVGIEIHEGIRLSEKAQDLTLLKGEVIAIEPGFYLPGKYGMRVEETVIVSR